jgi:hypothetical protein
MKGHGYHGDVGTEEKCERFTAKVHVVKDRLL